jgi:hypothetical protein
MMPLFRLGTVALLLLASLCTAVQAAPATATPTPDEWACCEGPKNP